MRTTLTIDDDLAAILEQERKRKGKSLKEVVNSLLRRGLELEHLAPARAVVVTRPHDFRFKAGVDLDKLNQLADDLEAGDAAASLRR